jgi:hypothetical protein
MMKRKYSTSLGVVRTAVLAAAVSIGAALISGNIHAQTSAVTSAPLLQSGSLVYDGAFRVPQGTSFAYGGGQLAFNPGGGLFVGGFPAPLVAEISIPTPVNSATVANLPMATLLQPFIDPTEGRIVNSGAGGAVFGTPSDYRLGGLMVAGGHLVGTVYVYYDGNRVQRLSHYTRPLNLSTTGQVGGLYNVGNLGPLTGMISGPMCTIPSAWQSLLGGPMITQNYDLSVPSRTSYGPAAFVFDPANLGRVDPVPATGLLYYPQDHQLGGTSTSWQTTSLIWNIGQIQGGCVFPTGSRSVLYFSVHGIGTYGYGDGTSDPALAGTINPGDGQPYFYDPESIYKGTHTYPYVYQVLAYDANDLLSVKNGTKQPWELQPYARWELSLPNTAVRHAFTAGNVAYDPATQRIFLAQGQADGWGEPLIHVFHIGPAAPSNVRIVSGNW